ENEDFDPTHSEKGESGKAKVERLTADAGWVGAVLCSAVTLSAFPFPLSPFGRLFTYQDGLLLPRAGLWLDVRRRQARSFVSHAHADHMARHELALCTPETGRLYQTRMGRRQVREMRLGEAIEFGPLRLTALGAGHCLGSAMLL